jgi:hypothetical protein
MEKKIIAQKDAKVNDSDRLHLASILLKFGYTVRIGKERRENERQNVIFVAYEERK